MFVWDMMKLILPGVTVMLIVSGCRRSASERNELQGSLSSVADATESKTDMKQKPSVTYDVDLLHRWPDGSITRISPQRDPDSLNRGFDGQNCSSGSYVSGTKIEVNYRFSLDRNSLGMDLYKVVRTVTRRNHDGSATTSSELPVDFLYSGKSVKIFDDAYGQVYLLPPNLTSEQMAARHGSETDARIASEYFIGEVIGTKNILNFNITEIKAQIPNDLLIWKVRGVAFMQKNGGRSPQEFSFGVYRFGGSETLWQCDEFRLGGNVLWDGTEALLYEIPRQVGESAPPQGGHD